MLTVPFLTDVDSRAEVKGSRDPLGAQAVWTRFGRHAVSNLTTVSTLLRDFTITILGYHFAERVADETTPGTELATFLKWEQLAGYARAKVRGDRSFRGRERVSERLSTNERVTLAEDRSGQILSNQKIYGLWGLYTSPARESGLLVGDPARNAASAQGLVDDVYLPRFAEYGFKGARKIVDLLKQPRPRIDPHKADLPLLQAVAAMLDTKLTASERKVYREHLVYGGRPADAFGNVQPLLASMLLKTAKDDDFRWSPSTVRALEKEAATHGELGGRLAKRLSDIRVCESLIGPCSMLFGYLLSLDGVELTDVAQRLRKGGGLELRRLIRMTFGSSRRSYGTSTTIRAGRWVTIAEAASAGDYARARTTARRSEPTDHGDARRRSRMDRSARGASGRPLSG